MSSMTILSRRLDTIRNDLQMMWDRLAEIAAKQDEILRLLKAQQPPTPPTERR